MSRIKYLAAALMSLLLLTGCASRQAPAATNPTRAETNYTVVKVTRGFFQKDAWCNAVVDCLIREPVSFEEEDAVLAENISLRAPARVQAGDVLARLTYETSEAQRLRLEYAVEQAEKAMEQGRSGYYRQISAITGSDEASEIARMQLQYSLAAYEIQAQANVDQARKNLEDYEKRYTEQVVVAPFDGVVLWADNLQEGTTVRRGQKLFEMADPAFFCLRLESPSDEVVNALSLGTKVTMEIQGEQRGAVVAATPNGLENPADNRNIYLTADWMSKIENDRLSVRVSCPLLRLNDMLMVRKKAVHTDGGASYVLVLEGDTLKRQYVLCGPENDDMVCILDGLTEGQQVVLN